MNFKMPILSAKPIRKEPPVFKERSFINTYEDIEQGIEDLAEKIEGICKRLDALKGKEALEAEIRALKEEIQRKNSFIERLLEQELNKHREPLMLLDKEDNHRGNGTYRQKLSTPKGRLP